MLVELARATHLQVLRLRMLSGNLQGQLLRMLCRMIDARAVLEIGTYTGYAAISMAMGMGEDGVLHTIDVNDELEDFTREFIRKSGLEKRIVFHVGDALEIIPELKGMFDLVLSMRINGSTRSITGWYLIRFEWEELSWRMTCCGTVRW